MAYSIRRMVREDLSQVTDIDREAFPTQWPPANYRNELNNQLAYYIVAWDDTRIAPAPAPGGLSRFGAWIKERFRGRHPVEIVPSTRQYLVGFSGIWLLTDEAHITNIAVRQNYQGKGLGELLLIATIDLAEDLDASTLTLEVRASNQVAQNLYTKYGFTATGIRKGYYLDNREDGIIMTTENIRSEAFQSRLCDLRDALGRKLR